MSQVDVKVEATTPREQAEAGARATKRPYQRPTLEKKRSVARVTLASGMGQAGVGVVMRM